MLVPSLSPDSIWAAQVADGIYPTWIHNSIGDQEMAAWFSDVPLNSGERLQSLGLSAIASRGMIPAPLLRDCFYFSHFLSTASDDVTSSPFISMTSSSSPGVRVSSSVLAVGLTALRS